MSILDTLAIEHRRFESRISDLMDAGSAQASQRADLFRELQSELTAHARAEEEVVYRVLRQRLPDEMLVAEGYEEHRLADLLLQELAAAHPDRTPWAAKLRVFGQVLVHHIKQEETCIFPLVARACDEHECVTMEAEFRAVRHPALEAAMAAVRRVVPTFVNRALVDIHASAGRLARRGELRVLRSLDQSTALRVPDKMLTTN